VFSLMLFLLRAPGESPGMRPTAFLGWWPSQPRSLIGLRPVVRTMLGRPGVPPLRDATRGRRQREERP